MSTQPVNPTPAAATGHESMPDYKRTLGFWDLFSISVGIIIGSGVLVFTGRAIAITGRSVCLAYLGACAWVICTAAPTILMCSVIRLLGGGYTQANLFLGEQWGGFYMSIYILAQMGKTLYAQTFALYFCELLQLDAKWEVPVAAVMITFFYILNFFGVDAMAKAQNLMTAVLLLALVWFVIRGLPQVNWSTFFDSDFMPAGLTGLFQASTLLTYSLMGATSLMPYSADAKNPQRDIPLAGAISTLSIAVLFALTGCVTSGVLPIAEVAGQSLGVVAREILSTPEYIFFMVGGALMAAATTLNGVIGSAPKPLVMLSHDGWLPRSLGVLHPKYKTAYKYLFILYIITIAPLFLGVDISSVSDITLLGSYTQTSLFIFFMRKIPDMFPEAWAQSIFHMPRPVFNIVMWICFFGSLSNLLGMFTNSTPAIIAINIVTMGAGIAYSLSMYKAGKVTPTQSYELADGIHDPGFEARKAAAAGK
ncbi:MAG: amino acid permease [Clostridia bacterium]|nr:amino acid permease [Clostridia bacterium]